MTADEARALRARNLDLFRHGVPEVHARLAEAATAERDAGNDAPAGPAFSRRFSLREPAPEDLDVHAFRFLEATLGRAGDDGIAFFPGPRLDDAYFLVVVGAGDDGRLVSLIERLKPLCVVVVEPDPATLLGSFDRVDWSAVFRAMLARKGELQFLIEGDANRVSANVWRVMRKTNPAAADGFTVVAHDHHDLARRLVKNLADEAQLIVSGLGFFHDEMLMLANAHRNLGAPGARVFKRARGARPRPPAFVVGSGPSLDWAIDAIKAQAEKAVVISCGSAFRPLVKQGVVPDFQIEMENINVSPVTAQAAREHGHKGVTLVTACTVDPDAVAAFDDVVFFFRKALSPYPLYCRNEDWSLPLPDPTVVNAGVSFAQATGFRDVYLFGVDFGSQLPYRHHAKDSFHHTAEASYRHVAYDIEVEANFGGTCYTDGGLYYARDMLAEAIRSCADGRRYFNCSDGVAIRGAQPTMVAALSLDGPAIDKRAEVAAIVAGFETGATLAGDWPGDAIAGAIGDYAARLKACLAAIDDFGDRGFHRPLMRILRPEMGYLVAPEPTVENAVNLLFRGTLFGMLIFFDYYLARVADPADVDRFGAIARDELIRRLDALVEAALGGLGGARPVAPTETVTAAAGERLPRPRRVGRNATCPCGSGAKYKHCHGKAD